MAGYHASRGSLPIQGSGTTRLSLDREAVKGMHRVSAYSTERGLCLSEVVVKEKTNEIPSVRDLLDIPEVRCGVVTWDALNTRKETVGVVIRKGGAEGESA